MSVQQCGDRYIQEIHDRGDKGVVLIHDIHSQSVDMVKYIVPKLKAKGYRFARIDQVPAINAQLVAKGWHPLAAITARPASAQSIVAADVTESKPQDFPGTGSCAADGVFCGNGGLYTCYLNIAYNGCSCADACTGPDGNKSCTCSVATSEPGTVDPTVDLSANGTVTDGTHVGDPCIGDNNCDATQGFSCVITDDPAPGAGTCQAGTPTPAIDPVPTPVPADGQ
jgi:hypothetical protein